MNLFFVSCPLGFETQLVKEIESFWFKLFDLDGLPTRTPLPEFKIVPGGLEFKTELHLGLQFNFFTKIGLRVLLRYHKFSARYFDQFEKELKKIDFKKVFSEKNICLNLESSKSRLFHESNLEEAATKVLSSQGFTVVKKNEATAQSLFIRFFKDEAQVSLDTTGEHLHFRKYRLHQGEAPLRENLASAMLSYLNLSYQQKIVFIDPFAGAGTLLFEAMLASGYPQLNREFAFFKLKNCPAIFKSPTWLKNYRWLELPQNWRAVGFEINTETFKKAKFNLIEFEKLFFSPQISFINSDSSNFRPEDLEFKSDEISIVVSNPPYGERLDQVSLENILAPFSKIKNLEGVLLLHPDDFKKSKDFKIEFQIPFSNQGLKINLTYLKPQVV